MPPSACSTPRRSELERDTRIATNLQQGVREQGVGGQWGKGRGSGGRQGGVKAWARKERRSELERDTHIATDLHAAGVNKQG